MVTSNERVDYHRAKTVLGQYSQRMEIESEYKIPEKHFMPSSASENYRIRILHFAIRTLLYDVWRMTNFTLRNAVDIDIGEPPPTLAGEFIKLIAFWLFDTPD